MLDDLSVEACIATPRADNRTALTLSVDNAMLRRMNVSAGSIIVGRAGKGCYTLAEDGLMLWQAKLQEWILDRPTISIAPTYGMATLHLVTAPAALHECFAYSQVEFYHGASAGLHVARTKRHQSFADKGVAVPPEIFASAESVVADAKAASARKRIAERLLARPSSAELDRRGPTNRTGRGLSHWCSFGASEAITIDLEGTDCSTTYEPCAETCAYPSDGACDDGGLGSEYSFCTLGTDCVDCGYRAYKCTDACEHASNGQCDDGGPGAESSSCEIGTDCTDCGSRAGRSAFEGLIPSSPSNDCYMRNIQSGRPDWFLRAGNIYKLKWWTQSSQSVRIRMFERDRDWFNADEYCYEIRGYAATNSGYNEHTFTMPSLSMLESRCQTDSFWSK